MNDNSRVTPNKDFRVTTCLQPLRRQPGLSHYLSAPSLLTCVFSGMGDERTRDGKGFSTTVTHVRFLSRVATHVVGERAGLSKALPAAIAHVGLLAAVLPAKQQTPVISGQKGKQHLPSISILFPKFLVLMFCELKN